MNPITEYVLGLEDLRDYLAFTPDVGSYDDAILYRLLVAANEHVERLLGYGLIERFDEASKVPGPLKEAILQLAAWWYENREAVSDKAHDLPFGTREIITEYREWSF
ncbi:head-tail connector protein [Palleronia sp. LCG004]|uniref:head-tail connector protein n=1 Tax=Palleronia sp. LCG004 TaxID=3079304 RepID=UPI002943EB51|nr:head-tail connector protein [Palleronia sp. LCG004]WOI55129.1 head-tail connector protein [Palleronia sp. LCG004]